MKRDHKAEAAKQQRKLNRQETDTRRVAILLTELETANAAVLTELFDFDRARVDNFILAVREFYASLFPAPLPVNPRQQLPLISQRFALAGMEALKKTEGFEAEQLDAWLKGLIDQASKARKNDSPP